MIKSEPLAPVGSDFADMFEAYGMSRLDEVARRFGTQSHDAKPSREVWRPITLTGGDGDYVAGRPPTKPETMSLMRSLNAQARVLHIRLEYLRQLDKHPQPKARKIVAEMFKITRGTLRGYLRPAKKKALGS